jgi:hypothetical protein
MRRASTDQYHPFEVRGVGLHTGSPSVNICSKVIIYQVTGSVNIIVNTIITIRSTIRRSS